MPWRPLLLDLREYPLCERPSRVLSSLEEMGAGEILMIIEDRDPHGLLDTLRLVLEGEFSHWIPENGPRTWRILVLRESKAPSSRILHSPG